MVTRDLTADTIEATIRQHDVVVVHGGSRRCAGAAAFQATFEACSEQHPDVLFGYVDLEAQPSLARSLQIASSPSVLVFRGGVLAFRQPGSLTPSDLEELIASVRSMDIEQLKAVMGQAQEEGGRSQVLLAVAARTGATLEEVARWVGFLHEEIAAALRRGDEVAFDGFGTFEVTMRIASSGRDPRTGRAMNIPASVKARWKPAAGLLD